MQAEITLTANGNKCGDWRCNELFTLGQRVIIVGDMHSEKGDDKMLISHWESRRRYLSLITGGKNCNVDSISVIFLCEKFCDMLSDF
jgi:hypothetical protein